MLPGMWARGQSRVLHVTSSGGREPVTHLLPYRGATFGAVGFSRGPRAELAREGITVATIVPGLMRTGSAINAYFKGDRTKECTLFGALASSPPFSMDLERAARQIVQALRRGEAERVLSLPALAIAGTHGLAPDLTTDLLALASRLLPANRPAGQERESGREIQARRPLARSPADLEQLRGAALQPESGPDRHGRRPTGEVTERAGPRRAPLIDPLPIGGPGSGSAPD